MNQTFSFDFTDNEGKWTLAYRVERGAEGQPTVRAVITDLNTGEEQSNDLHWSPGTANKDRSCSTPKEEWSEAIFAARMACEKAVEIAKSFGKTIIEV